MKVPTLPPMNLATEPGVREILGWEQRAGHVCSADAHDGPGDPILVAVLAREARPRGDLDLAVGHCFRGHDRVRSLAVIHVVVGVDDGPASRRLAVWVS